MMKKFFLNKIDDEPLSPDAVSAVHAMYLPPAVSGGDAGYWSVLEQRIVSRVTNPSFVTTLETKWWSVLGDWSSAGIVAAGIAVAVSAALIQNAASEESSAVYEYVSATPAPEAFAPPVDLVTQRGQAIQNDAIINYVLAR